MCSHCGVTKLFDLYEQYTPFGYFAIGGSEPHFANPCQTLKHIRWHPLIATEFVACCAGSGTLEEPQDVCKDQADAQRHGHTGS